VDLAAEGKVILLCWLWWGRINCQTYGGRWQHDGHSQGRENRTRLALPYLLTISKGDWETDRLGGDMPCHLRWWK